MWPIVALVVVLLAGGAIRFVGITSIDRQYFDEKYYVVQANERLMDLEPGDRPAHPPLGTWMIAGGIALAGDNPLGWRMAPAAAGTFSIWLTYAVALRIWRRRWIGVAAASLFALDGLAIATSRIAILDGLQVPFALGAVLCGLKWSTSSHRWLWLAGAGGCAGAMAAIKWNGVLLLVVLAVWLLVVQTLRSSQRPRLTAVLGGLGVAAFVVGIAVMTYVATYTSWFVDYRQTQTADERCLEDGACGVGVGDRVSGWLWEQQERVDFHRRLKATHPDRSSAVEWPLLTQPVTVFLERCPQPAASDCSIPAGHTRRILAVGNPALWWPGFLSIPIIGFIGVRRHQSGVVLAALAPLGMWLPWLASPKPGFIYFLTPVVPFLAIACAGALASVPWRRARRGALAGSVLLVVAAFVWWAPLTFGWDLSPEAVAARNLFPSWPGG